MSNRVPGCPPFYSTIHVELVNNIALSKRDQYQFLVQLGVV